MPEPVLRAQEAAIAAWHGEGGAGEPPAAAETPPTLIVHGTEDIVIPAANAEPLAARWPGARVELLPGAGHAVMAQESQRVAALVAELLAG